MLTDRTSTGTRLPTHLTAEPIKTSVFNSQFWCDAILFLIISSLKYLSTFNVFGIFNLTNDKCNILNVVILVKFLLSI